MHKYVVEFLGTTTLVFVGTFTFTHHPENSFLIASAFALALAILTFFLRRFSGAHLNPAVSLGAWISGQLSSHDIVPYFFAQFGGAVLGSFLLAFLLPPELGLGETTFSLLSVRLAFLMELLLTGVMVFLVLWGLRRRLPNLLQALLSGGLLFLATLFALPLTGAALNPARAIAPVVVGGNVTASEQIWVYACATLLAGMLAGIAMHWGRFLRR